MFDQSKMIKTCAILVAACAAIYASKNIFISHANNPVELVIPAVDFDKSMQLENHQEMLAQPSFEKLYTVCKNQYNTYHPANTKPSNKLRIPKKLHQIWLGGNGKLPYEYKEFQKSWQKHHPDWEYKLWTEKDLATFPFKNRDLFDASVNYGEKSDIWRYEILEKEGGLYIDTDYECLAPLDVFHYTYDFYTGIQPMDTNMVQLGIGLIGARPGHPLLKLAILNLRHTQDTEQIIAKTGPVFFTRIYYNAVATTGMRDVAFPASYFYPKGYEQRTLNATHWIKPESFAVHHWAGSWLKKEAFVSPKNQK
jgi:mannosyltransferase OCH1-like enzyme